ncbi:MAG: TRAP transporter small permease [Rikenellaceae bacterium]
MRSRIDRVLEVVLCALLSLLVIDVLWQIASRYVLASPSSVTDEIAGFLLVWVGLLGSAYCYGCGDHLAVDLLLQRVGATTQSRLRLLINIVVAIFAALVMSVGGGWLVYTRFYLGVTSAALSLNLGYVYAVLPLSGVLTLYYAIDNIVNSKNLKIS